MKLVIAGSRHMSNDMACLIPEAIEFYTLEPTEIVCGMARGADLLGKAWAEHQHIQVKEFPADWEKYGKAAGPIRNKEMALYCDAALVFIWDGSRGSANMVFNMQQLEKPCFVVENGVIHNET